VVGAVGCGGTPYDCGGIRGIITEANSVAGFWSAEEEYFAAEPGFRFIEVVVEPDPGYFPRNIGYGDCTVDLVDARGNRYERFAQGWYGTTQQYRFYYRVPDDANGFRFEGTDLGL
jgi:catechol 2,3-dioxygenase-like lactoylglutathione lyase family enzyme